jgi:hypothetical protein
VASRHQLHAVARKTSGTGTGRMEVMIDLVG